MRLNLGAADWHLEGYESVDLQQVDLSAFPWPWESLSVEAIYAGHILEHFDRNTGIRFLGECKRVLSEGGTLFLAVPDMDLFIDCMLSGDLEPLDGYAWRDLNHLLGGDDTEIRAEWRHKYMYCWASLAWTLSYCGFRQITHDHYRELDNPDYRAISLYARAIK